MVRQDCCIAPDRRSAADLFCVKEVGHRVEIWIVVNQNARDRLVFGNIVAPKYGGG